MWARRRVMTGEIANTRVPAPMSQRTITRKVVAEKANGSAQPTVALAKHDGNNEVRRRRCGVIWSWNRQIPPR
jgi:hypothetical protein